LGNSFEQVVNQASLNLPNEQDEDTRRQGSGDFFKAFFAPAPGGTGVSDGSSPGWEMGVG
jgi:hypothetical protein